MEKLTIIQQTALSFFEENIKKMANADIATDLRLMIGPVQTSREAFLDTLPFRIPDEELALYLWLPNEERSFLPETEFDFNLITLIRALYRLEIVSTLQDWAEMIEDLRDCIFRLLQSSE